ncbi:MULTISPECIES: sortase [Anaerolinea]|uniref:sortase n=1 Tax=Anaerolinea TaxID=233189 RepID=UPI00261F33E2|nr:sortase [Anaerolinea thermophila]
MKKAILRWTFFGVGTVLLVLGTWSYFRPAPVNAATEVLQALGEGYDPYLVQVLEPSSSTNTILPDTYQYSTDLYLVEESLESPLNLPESIIIPAIQLEAPVQVTRSRKIIVRGVVYEQWLVPDTFAVGWNPSASTPGSGGNIVLYGHHNVKGAVFSRLYQVQRGDEITLVSRGLQYHYSVTDIQKVKEKDVSFAQMLKNAELLKDTPEEQLTLVTCWPPYDSTHRLIVIAKTIP